MKVVSVVVSILPANLSGASVWKMKIANYTRGFQRQKQILKKQSCVRNISLKSEMFFLVTEALMCHIVNNLLSGHLSWNCNDQVSVNSLKAFLGWGVGWVFGKRKGIEP